MTAEITKGSASVTRWIGLLGTAENGDPGPIVPRRAGTVIMVNDMDAVVESGDRVEKRLRAWIEGETNFHPP